MTTCARALKYPLAFAWHSSGRPSTGFMGATPQAYRRHHLRSYFITAAAHAAPIHARRLGPFSATSATPIHPRQARLPISYPSTGSSPSAWLILIDLGSPAAQVNPFHFVARPDHAHSPTKGLIRLFHTHPPGHSHATGSDYLNKVTIRLGHNTLIHPSPQPSTTTITRVITVDPRKKKSPSRTHTFHSIHPRHSHPLHTHPPTSHPSAHVTPIHPRHTHPLHTHPPTPHPSANATPIHPRHSHCLHTHPPTPHLSSLHPSTHATPILSTPMRPHHTHPPTPTPIIHAISILPRHTHPPTPHPSTHATTILSTPILPTPKPHPSTHSIPILHIHRYRIT
ncbi:extensin-like [Penaeus japonicus]|uniref:extensin-like n=1 Tax=Penaeus japonicus TaxID=27405 RepID=UPI001C70CE28|nr:extensin-like [Penaeus japonicus]